ncbi:efflux RND transporter periplasmic adaptor subunit [Aliiglaciecola aliphaticivorans]
MKGFVNSIFIATSLLVITSTSAQQFSLDVKDLNDLALLTKQVEQVNEYAGLPTLGEVSELPGQGYTIHSPFTAQQVRFLQPVGTKLNIGGSFVELSGPEVHHYFNQYQVKKSLFELTELQYKKNKSLFKQSSISQQAWLDINNAYFAAKLEYDEMQHFFELVADFNDETETLTLKTPINGVVHYTRFESLTEGNVIARVIPTQSIRLNFNISNNEAQNLAYLSATNSQCKLNIYAIELVATGLASKVWSAPLTSDCPYNLGQNLSVTPFFKQQAYLVPKNSVFSMNGSQFVFVKSGEQLNAINVTLISSTEHSYAITSQQSLINSNVLISSVSAAQGILLGLGSE